MSIGRFYGPDSVISSRNFYFHSTLASPYKIFTALAVTINFSGNLHFRFSLKLYT